MKKSRQRYILFKIILQEKINIDRTSLTRAMWGSIWRYFGMRGANKIGLWLIDLDVINGFGIVRCSNITKDVLITSLTLITELEGKRAILSPIKTSGTIKSINLIKEKLIN